MGGGSCRSPQWGPGLALRWCGASAFSRTTQKKADSVPQPPLRSMQVSRSTESSDGRGVYNLGVGASSGSPGRPYRARRSILAIGIEPVVERLQADAQDVGGLLLVAAVEVERRHDQPALDLGDRGPHLEVEAAHGARFAAHLARQAARGDL